MSFESRRGFTLLEMLIVVLISSVITMTVSLFLQKSVSMFKRTDHEAELTRRLLFALDRLRKCARHSTSVFQNWRNSHAVFERTETLFFTTDFDQDNEDELHFIWFDRRNASNTNGKNLLIHVWDTQQNLRTAPGMAGGMQMPPDMADSATFNNIITHLRDPSNFNSGGPPRLETGWEALLEAPLPRPELTPLPANTPAVYLGKWVRPDSATWPSDENGVQVPRSGIAFNVDDLLVTAPGAVSPAYTMVNAASPALGRKTILNELCIAGNTVLTPTPTPPYRRTSSVLGSPHCQVYISIFMDSNQNGSINGDSLPDVDEASVQILTSINMLLIPSAGLSSP